MEYFLENDSLLKGISKKHLLSTVAQYNLTIKYLPTQGSVSKS